MPPTFDYNRRVAQAADDKMAANIDRISGGRFGLDLVLVQCSPMLEEVRRIGRDVIPRLQAATAV